MNTLKMHQIFFLNEGFISCLFYLNLIFIFQLNSNKLYNVAHILNFTVCKKYVLYYLMHWCLLNGFIYF